MPGAQALQLLQLRGHRFRRASAVPFALDDRIGAIAAPEAAAALGLKVQRSISLQIRRGDGSGPVFPVYLSHKRARRTGIDHHLPIFTEYHARDSTDAPALLDSRDQRDEALLALTTHPVIGSGQLQQLLRENAEPAPPCD